MLSFLANKTYSAMLVHAHHGAQVSVIIFVSSFENGTATKLVPEQVSHVGLRVVCKRSRNVFLSADRKMQQKTSTKEIKHGIKRQIGKKIYILVP